MVWLRIYICLFLFFFCVIYHFIYQLIIANFFSDTLNEANRVEKVVQSISSSEDADRIFQRVMEASACSTKRRIYKPKFFGDSDSENGNKHYKINKILLILLYSDRGQGKIYSIIYGDHLPMKR